MVSEITNFNCSLTKVPGKLLQSAMSKHGYGAIEIHHSFIHMKGLKRFTLIYKEFVPRAEGFSMV